MADRFIPDNCPDHLLCNLHTGTRREWFLDDPLPETIFDTFRSVSLRLALLVILLEPLKLLYAEENKYV